MADPANSAILVGRVNNGYVIQVVGRGTARESVAVARFVTEALESENVPLTIDLSACDYLDSTFLGCLATMSRQYGQGSLTRFTVAASPEKCRKLLAPCRLDTFLKVTDSPPAIEATMLMLYSSDLDELELGRHVMQSHRILAELGGPHSEAFAGIANQLQRELAAKESPRGVSPEPRIPPS